MTHNFENIIKGCLKRNRNSQHQLYKMYYGYGMRIGIRHTRNEEEAIQVLNNSFMKVFSKISKYKSEADFKINFKRIIEQTAVNHLRKRNNTSIYSHLMSSKKLNLKENIKSKILQFIP